MLEINDKLIKKTNIITDGAPVKTGKKIDGKDEWVKRINFGSLPNAGGKNVAHGLNVNNITITFISAIVKNVTTNDHLNIPYAVAYQNPSGLSNISLDITPGGIYIYTGVNRSSLTAIVEIYFTYN